MLIILSVVIFAGLVLVIFGLNEAKEREKILAKLSIKEKYKNSKENILVILGKIFKGLIKINGMFMPKEIKENIGKKMNFINKNISPEEFILIKELSFLALFIAIPFALDMMDIIVMIISGVFGLFLPELWLKNQIESRKKVILKELPDIIDLLALCTEAGLSLDMAFNKIISAFKKGILKDELSQVFYEIKIGKNKKEAFKDMSRKMNLPEISSFISIISQAEQLGVGVSKTLKSFSSDMRIKYYQRVEKMAFEAPIKLLFPLIVFIFPTTFLILLGPLIINFMKVLSL